MHERLSPSEKGHSTKDADFAVAGSWSGQRGAAGAQDYVKGSGRAESLPQLVFKAWDHQGNMDINEKCVLCICVSAVSNLPCRDSSGSVAWILFLVPVECWSWSEDLAAQRQELQPQGLQAWPPGT